MARLTDDRAAFGWRTFTHHLASFTVLLLAAALLLGASIGMKPLEARAAGAVAHAGPHIDIAWPPLGSAKPGTWLPRDQQERLAALAASAAGEDPSLFSPDPLRRISEALARTGWFSAAPLVRRCADGRILVEGAWRVPAAVVRKNGKDRVISWDARLLPLEYETGRAKLPAILEPALEAPAAGAAWSGEDIAASLELLSTVLREPWAAQVTGIDASQYSASASLSIVTSAGRVVWGGRPSKPRVGEVSTRQKLLHLLQLQHDFNRIDAGYPLIYVNSARLQFDTSASAAARAQQDAQANPDQPQ